MFAKRIVVLCCVLALILIPLGSAAFGASDYVNDDMTPERMAADVLVVRPIGMVASVAGCAIYLISLPFSIPGDNADKVWEKAVVAPVKYTFDRPVGEF